MGTDQREYWNGEGGRRWGAALERTDRNLASITEVALGLAAPRAGERVLDVGCGCGTTSFLLRERVGGSGAVLGLDISGPMLEVARARGGNVEFVEGDAATYALPRGAFQLVFSRFGVMFFDDPIAAFTNLHRAVAPDGRLAFVCWRALAQNPWANAPLEAARDLLPPSKLPEPGAPGGFAFADRDRVEHILATAGFHDVRIEAHDSTMHLGVTLDDALDGVMALGPLAAAVGELDDAARGAIRERIAPVLARFGTAGGVAPAAAVWLVAAGR